MTAGGESVLAGFSVNPGTYKDILIVKVNPAGDTLWTFLYNGPGNGEDEAMALTLDAAGNAYVTGTQRTGSTGSDIVTLKVSAAGTLMWSAVYAYASDEYDQGNALAVDGAGNVFVAGQSDQDPSLVTNYDYVVLKYDANGNQIWATRSVGVGNGNDKPAKLLLGTDGNPVVTGQSFNGGDDDYLTIKYNAASGAAVWSQLIDRTHHDRPTDMVIHPSTGNIYITGRSGNGTNYDYLTVCYATAGTVVWQAFYDYLDDDRATGIAVDGAGNAFVTGQSDANATALFNYNFTTVKYNSLGQQQWAHTLAGTGGGDDIPVGVKVSAAGEVFVGGYTNMSASGTLAYDLVLQKLDATGNTIWTKTYNSGAQNADYAAGLALDGSGNAVLVGYGGAAPHVNGLALRYDVAGNIVFQRTQLAVGDNIDNSRAIVIDGFGNAFVAGGTVEVGTERNFCIRRIDAIGNTVWTSTLDGTSKGSPDDAVAVALDAQGNVCVAGYVKNKGTSNDIVVAKYTPQGLLLWASYYDGPANESDRAYALALDGVGNVYVTGRSDSDPLLTSNDDVVTLKYSSAGLLVWAQRYNGVGNGSDFARSMKVTVAGDVYVGGRSFNGANLDFLMLHYNAAGALLGTGIFDGGMGDDDGQALAIDALGNSYLVGSSAASQYTDILTVKFNATGAVQWNQRFNGTANGEDVGNGVFVSANGDVAICGTTDTDTATTNRNADIYVANYSGAGTLNWSHIYDGTNGGEDDASEITGDATGRLFVTGTSDHGNPGSENMDFITLQYASNGARDTVLYYDGPDRLADAGNAIHFENGAIYITGASLGITTQRDVATLKYQLLPVGIAPSTAVTVEVSAFPNPASDHMTVRVAAQQGRQLQNLSARLLTIQGQQLGNWPLVGNADNHIELGAFATGIYLLQVQQGHQGLAMVRISIIR